MTEPTEDRDSRTWTRVRDEEPGKPSALRTIPLALLGVGTVTLVVGAVMAGVTIFSAGRGAARAGASAQTYFAPADPNAPPAPGSLRARMNDLSSSGTAGDGTQARGGGPNLETPLENEDLGRGLDPNGAAGGGGPAPSVSAASIRGLAASASANIVAAPPVLASAAASAIGASSDPSTNVGRGDAGNGGSSAAPRSRSPELLPGDVVAGGGLRTTTPTSLLIPMSPADGLEDTWTSVSPFVRSGDVLVAKASDIAAAQGVSAWGERIRTDSPLASFVVALPDGNALGAFLQQGVPAAVTGLGISSGTGLDAAQFARLAASVHSVGKRFFVSVSTGDTQVPLSVVGSMADMVELVPGGGSSVDSDELIQSIGVLRSAGSPQLFVRLPASAAGSALRVSSSAQGINGLFPSVGVALPSSANAGTTLSDFRATPP